MHSNEKIDEQSIISLLETNSLIAWEKLYDKYASSMYGLICSLTDDAVVAEEIFIASFLMLKEKKVLSNLRFSLCVSILRHTYAYTVSHLNELGLSAKSYKPLEEIKLIHLLCTQSKSLKEVASILNLSEEETKKILCLEISSLRNQKPIQKKYTLA